MTLKAGCDRPLNRTHSQAKDLAREAVELTTSYQITLPLSLPSLAWLSVVTTIQQS